MGRIQVLDPHVVNQIAAGEVIERPASVVKELVENALDAGARRVDVRIEDGGRALIEVADDGWGLEPEDLERAFLPHATSKVACVEDLLHVSSLGFRGEALASIGSVARVRITTRPRKSDSGWTILDDMGAIGTVEPAAASPGTVLRVEGLFARVPARRKFMRTAATEQGHVVQWMGRFAIANPDVAFRLASGDRVLLDVSQSADRRERIAAVHGQEIAEGLLLVEGESADLRLEGWAGPPSMHRGDGRLEQAFLNGRHVKDRTVAHALRQAYGDLLPPGGRRPIAFLFLTCDPGRVDVNVHPAKAEVRWRDGGSVHRLVQQTLRRALEGVAPGVPVDLEGPAPRPSTAQAAEFAFTHGVGRHLPGTAGAGRVGPGAASGAGAGSGWGSPSVRDRPAGSDGTPASEATSAYGSPGADSPGRDSPAGRLRPVGQALGTYLVLEGEDEIVLVDQHALHERILYEEISARLRERGALEVQRLLMPTVVHLGPAEVGLLAESADVLQSLGWIVEPFGDDAVAVQGIPAVLRRPDPEATLREVLEGLSAGRRDGLDKAALVKEAVDRLACRSAVMAGDRLAHEEVVALLERAESLDHSHSCPHGRPTRLTLSRSRLERWFHRTV